MSAPSANRQIARAASTVMAAFVLSNLTGLLRQVLVTRAFGTSGDIDAFSAASTFPDLVFSLIAGGALASAFVPTLTGFLTRDDRKGGWLLSSALMNLVFVLLILTSLLSAIFAPQIVKYILAPGFSPDQQALTTSLLRILLIAPAIFGVSGLWMGILNAHQVFLWPALAPSMYWLGMILGVLFLTPYMGIYGLAWGAVFGALLHLLVQLPAGMRLPAFQFFPTFGLSFPAVRQVGRLMVPRLVGVAVVQINFVVITIIASGQPEGSLAAVKYAWAIMTMPQVVIAQSIAIAALPTFSALFARGELDQMRASLAATLRGVILLALPATLGLILLRQPVVAMLFERGQFDQHSTDLVAWALLWFTAGLAGHSIVEIVSRAFYAMHDTRTPVVVGTIAMSLNLAFSFIFSAWFTRLGWMPHGGLALANSLATALESLGLLFYMRRRLHGLDGRVWLKGSLVALAAVLVMCAVLAIWLAWQAGRPSWWVAVVGILLGGLVYGAALLAMGIPEARQLLALAARRLGRTAA
jgi:putative peptidoglycan lipid II flippase